MQEEIKIVTSSISRVEVGLNKEEIHSRWKTIKWNIKMSYQM